jgi:hypothetical protein
MRDARQIERLAPSSLRQARRRRRSSRHRVLE